jgi:hypothetical protein
MNDIRRSLVLCGIVLGLGIAVPIALGSAGGDPRSAPAPTCPAFDPGTFHRSTTVDNRYFPLAPGTRFVYKGTVETVAVVGVVTVTRHRPTIAGVRTVEARDKVFEDGVLTEDTLDWYAQDDEGNVWYMGEFATQLPDGTHNGSWTAGVDGAEPGFIMEARPRVGDSYCQENAPDVAQDAAQVLSVTASRTVPVGTFRGNVLKTKDFSLIEPGAEHKFYAPGVGLIEALSVSGPSEDIKLTSVDREDDD